MFEILRVLKNFQIERWQTEVEANSKICLDFYVFDSLNEFSFFFFPSVSHFRR